MAFLLLVCAAGYGCRKESRLDCLLSAGPVRERVVSLPLHPFALRVYDDVAVTWVASDTPRIEFRSGRNLLGRLEALSLGQTLEIRNPLRCNWVRDYSTPVEARLFCRSFSDLEINGYGRFRTLDTLQNKVVVVRQFGAGESDVLVKADSLHIGFVSYGKMRVSGRADRAFYFTLGMGHVETDQLEARRVKVEAEGNRLTVWARDSLRAEIRNSHTVYYRGRPGIRLRVLKGGRLERLLP